MNDLETHGFSDEEQRSATHRVLHDLILEKGDSALEDRTLREASVEAIITPELQAEIENAVEKLAREQGISPQQAAALLTRLAEDNFREQVRKEKEEQ